MFLTISAAGKPSESLFPAQLGSLVAGPVRRSPAQSSTRGSASLSCHIVWHWLRWRNCSMASTPAPMPGRARCRLEAAFEDEVCRGAVLRTAARKAREKAIGLLCEDELAMVLGLWGWAS